MQQQTETSQSAINPALFPGINLEEQSTRAGYNGPRYVPIAGKDQLGDTNTGRFVYPVGNGSSNQSNGRRLLRWERMQEQKSALYGDGGK